MSIDAAQDPEPQGLCNRDTHPEASLLTLSNSVRHSAALASDTHTDQRGGTELQEKPEQLRPKVLTGAPSPREEAGQDTTQAERQRGREAPRTHR